MINLGNRTASLLTLVLVGVGGATEASAQTARRDVQPLDLPRPGYEYDGHRVGPVVILPEVEFGTEYDNNLFATSINEVSDIRFELAPSMLLKRDYSNGRLRADVHARFRRHADNPRENSEEFGAFTSYEQTNREGRRVFITGKYDRSIETRGDPETRAGPTDRPRKLDVVTGEVSWREPVGRMFIEGTFAAEKVNYLEAAEDDRDLLTYRGSLRIAYRVSAETNVFVESYVNRRDFRLPLDFGGVNRDATTVGAFGGVQKELGQRLRGKIGVGLFRAGSDSPTINSFTGVAVSGELNWNPRVRTALTLRASRGDVATVRNGSIARIDTIVRLSVNQEIRHNLLLHASVGYVDRYYRGNVAGRLKTFSGQTELEFLINRRVALFAGASYADRNALGAADRFERAAVKAGVRFKL